MNRIHRMLLDTPLGAVLLGAAFFLAAFGPRILDPTHIRWLMESDPSQNYLGWLFFSNEPWTFPPGAIRHLGLSGGTSIAFTDSAPLLAFLFKAFGAVLPRPFQYFGFWILACYMLQGFFGWRLGALASHSPADRLLLASLFILSPSMLYRGEFHYCLMGHWTLLAGLMLVLEKGPSGRFRWKAWSLLLVSTALLHMYFLAFLLALYSSVLLQWAGSRPAKDPSALFVRLIPFPLILAAMYMEGFFLLPPSGWQVGDPYDFVRYSMNLLAPFNPMAVTGVPGVAPHAYSLFFQPLPAVSNMQYEGFNYLGAGTLLLLLSAWVAALVPPRARWLPALRGALREHRILVVVLGFLALFSLSNQWTLGPKVLFMLRLPMFLMVQLASFRASGRFFWVPGYAALLFSAWFLGKALPSPKGALTFLLAGAVLLQSADLSPYIGWMHAHANREIGFKDPFESPDWKGLIALKQEILFYPMEGAPRFLELGLVAAELHKRLNIAYCARYDAGALKRMETEIREDWLGARLRKDALYITEDPALAAALRKAKGPGVRLFERDGYFAAYKTD